jgi:hypothetical protein
VRVGRLAQHRGHAAAGRHRHRFALGVHGREEDDARVFQRRLGAQLLDELVAIHRRHQDVGDDEVGQFGARDGQRAGAVFGFEDAVPGQAEQGAQIAAVAGPVVDNQNGRHQ